MIDTLLSLLVALLIWPTVIVAPGYAVAMLLRPLASAQLSLAKKLLLSMPLSLCVSPIALYFLWKYAGYSAAVGLVGICTAAMLVDLLLQFPQWKRVFVTHRFVLISIAIWMIVVVAMLLPIEGQRRVFLSTPWNDYATRIAMTNAISRTGVPPEQPFLAPGYRLPTFYYYGWFIQSSLVDSVGGTIVDADHAVMAGVVMTSISLLAVLLLMSRHMSSDGDANPRQRDKWIVLLLLVTGLDIFPALGRNISFWLLHKPGYSRTAEWWNEQVTAWTDMVLWVPHHVGGAVAMLMGLMLLRHAAETRTRTTLHVCLAAVAFASCGLMSVYLALAAAVVSVVWIVCSLYRGRSHEALIFITAGIMAAILAVPFLLELHAAKMPGVAPLAISIRRFGPLETLIRGSSLDRAAIKQPLFLLLLPVNYAMEFGFFAFAAWRYWRDRRRKQAANRPNDQFLIAIVASLLILATFVKSSLAYNDLGWRTMIPVQAVLLIWATTVMCRWQEQSRRAKKFGSALMAIGIASSCYNLLLMRGAGFVDYAAYPGSDLSKPAFDLREAHRWLDQHAAPTAVVQFNPVFETCFLQSDFNRRQIAVAHEELGMLLGISRSFYEPYRRTVDAIFEKPVLDEASLAALSGLKIDFLLVRSDDRLYEGRAGYERGIVFSNPTVAIVDLARLSR